MTETLLSLHWYFENSSETKCVCSIYSLGNSLERNSQLLTELDHVRQQAEESEAETKLLRICLAIMQPSYDQLTAGHSNMKQNFSPRMIQALTSTKVNKPGCVRMSNSVLSVPDHPAFDTPYQHSELVDFNGEFAWVSILLAVQHNRLLVPKTFSGFRFDNHKEISEDKVSWNQKCIGFQ